MPCRQIPFEIVDRLQVVLLWRFVQTELRLSTHMGHETVDGLIETHRVRMKPRRELSIESRWKKLGSKQNDQDLARVENKKKSRLLLHSLDQPLRSQSIQYNQWVSSKTATAIRRSTFHCRTTATSLRSEKRYVQPSRFLNLNLISTSCDSFGRHRPVSARENLRFGGAFARKSMIRWRTVCICVHSRLMSVS